MASKLELLPILAGGVECLVIKLRRHLATGLIAHALELGSPQPVLDAHGCRQRVCTQEGKKQRVFQGEARRSGGKEQQGRE